MVVHLELALQPSAQSVLEQSVYSNSFFNFLFIFSQMIETFFQMIFCQSKNNLNQRNFMSQSASSNSDSSHLNDGDWTSGNVWA